jgi:uncharacterized protein YodC (DUF2158 family)
MSDQPFRGFSEGDLVELKSGGATMTVERVRCPHDIQICECVWHDKDLNPRNETYPEHVLKLITDDPPF